jgi:hypothetical protein
MWSPEKKKSERTLKGSLALVEVAVIVRTISDIHQARGPRLSAVTHRLLLREVRIILHFGAHMKLAILLISSLLAGCGLIPDMSRYDKNSLVYKQCAYEARSNTPGNLGAMEAAVRELDLTDMCMKAKGY